jgi:hypothetical protein
MIQLRLGWLRRKLSSISSIDVCYMWEYRWIGFDSCERERKTTPHRTKSCVRLSLEFIDESLHRTIISHVDMQHFESNLHTFDREYFAWWICVLSTCLTIKREKLFHLCTTRHFMSWVLSVFVYLSARLRLNMKTNLLVRTCRIAMTVDKFDCSIFGNSFSARGLSSSTDRILDNDKHVHGFAHDS